MVISGPSAETIDSLVKYLKDYVYKKRFCVLIKVLWSFYSFKVTERLLFWKGGGGAFISISN